MSSTFSTLRASSAKPVTQTPRAAAPDQHEVFSLNRSLAAVAGAKASDLHLTAGARVRWRVDGDLRDAPWAPAEVLDNTTLEAELLGALTSEQRDSFLQRNELDFAYALSAHVRFRANFYRQRGKIGAAFRLIPNEIRPLGDLGVPAGVADFAYLPRGLVLVTGPTGSGKSTTLASLIDVANTHRDCHIVTVEDPIEFQHVHKRSIVTQREVGVDTESFDEALKRVLRQDPDIILIGELRDPESIGVALTAAETGHLVFGTLHTRDAAQSIDRIIDSYPAAQQPQVRAQLSGALEGVISQTLVKRIGGGRVVATEVMRTTPAIAHLLREGKTHQLPSSLQAGAELGMHTMDQDLARLVMEGSVSKAAALERSSDPEVFTSLITGSATGGRRAGEALGRMSREPGFRMSNDRSGR